MAYTMQRVVDQGRVPINDASKVRFTDLNLLEFAKDAIQMVLSRRPDLFYGRFSALPDITTLTLASALPVDDTLAPAISDYITARAESGNDESVVEQRAQMFYGLFGGQL